jgi:glycerol-3-phosphate acyltransferase PlsY
MVAPAWLFLEITEYNHGMTWVLYVLLAFLLGSLPFSVWFGKLFLGLDVRRFGDGNPGAVNAYRAGGRLAGLFIMLLDISKAAAPVGIAYFKLGTRGAPMFFIAIAPILGHVFSPFLSFRGGKAIATAFGVWIGLTIWKVSLPAVIVVLVGLALFRSPGWAVMLAMGAVLITLLLWLPDLLLLSVWAAETIILAWTHRADLRQRPRLRLWLKAFQPGK